MLKIDGSQKSGSGTIVRDVIPFAILMGKDVRLTHIRARREKPGLRPQHLKALQACAEMCQGRLEGATVGSREIVFRPGKTIRGGNYDWDIGTAGSAIMLAFTVIPLALFANGPCTFHITGGLFQDFAPSVFHFQHVLLPLLHQMAVQIEVKIIRPGYVPRGQGQIRISVNPIDEPLRSLSLLEQGAVSQIRGLALSSFLKERKVSERMATTCSKKLQSKGFASDIGVIYDTKDHPAYREAAVQAGAGLAIWATTASGSLLGSDMAGKIRRSAEFIGEQTAKNLIRDLSTGATVDRHLADQLIPYAALAHGTSSYLIPRMTDHIESRLWLVEELLGAKTEMRNSQLTIAGMALSKL